MAEHNSFLIYKDNAPLAESCTDEQAGKLFKALFAFACNGEELQSDDPMLKGFYTVFRNAIERDDIRYQDRCRKNALNGARGGRPRNQNEPIASDCNRSVSIASDDNQSQAKKADSESDSESEIDIESDRGRGTGETTPFAFTCELSKNTPSDDSIKTADSMGENGIMSATDALTMPKSNVYKRFTKPTVDEVRAYCEQRNNGIDPVRFVNFYESKDWMIGKNKMKDWKAAVRTWEQTNKKQQKQMQDRNAFNRFEQNQYDFDQLEKDFGII